MLVLLGVLAMVSGCAATPAAYPSAPSRVAGARVLFDFRGPNGHELSSKSTRGRATLVALITTYDLGSQVVARRLEELRRGHVPRINVGVVVMEAPSYAVLASVFPQSLGLGYPVTMADAPTLSGSGPFGQVDRLPVTFVLNEQGVITARLEGSPELPQLEHELRRAEASK